MELIRVENLTKIYGKGENEVRALDGVSFSVEKWEFIAVIGPSGSGKSTLLHILGGVDRPTSGKVYVDGQDVYAQNEEQLAIFRRRHVGLIYQFYNLIPVLNVAENITLTNLKRISRFGFLNKEEEAFKAKDLIERLEIEAGEYEITNNLSGGNQKKVIFAKWLFTNAKILIIDEPTAGIDVSSKVDIYNIINELLLSGASVIMISSDLSEILGMCDRVLVMCNGEVCKVFEKDEATQEKILYYASGGKDSI